MGMKFCPNCKEVVVTKVIGDYSLIIYHGASVKRRKIGSHLESNGGWGCAWWSFEVPDDLFDLDGSNL